MISNQITVEQNTFLTETGEIELIWNPREEEGLAELGESLHSLLSNLDKLGMDAIPPELELEMRRAMSMSPTFQAPYQTIIFNLWAAPREK